MRHAGQRVAATHIERPFPKDRAVDQRVIPHRLAGRRPCEGDLTNGVDRNECDIPGAQHLNIMVRLAELRVAEVDAVTRSEEHTSELQSLMRISYAVFCLKKKKRNRNQQLPETTLH